MGVRDHEEVGMATVRATNLMLEGGWTWGDGVRAMFTVTLEGVWGRYWEEWSDIWAYGWRVEWVGKGTMRLVRRDSRGELWHRAH